MKRDLHLCAATVTLCSFLAASSVAGAQPKPAAPASPAAAPTTPAPAGGAPQTSDLERARVHYDRGIQLYNEENYDAALFEFERAYELAPSYKILYNMARIQRQQNNYAAALINFKRYLQEGQSNIPDERKKEVDHEIELLKPRVATIDIKVNVDGADVYLDDSPVCTGVQTGCIGKSPLPGPVTVNPGRRKITAQKTGYAPGSAIVRVVGSDNVSAQVEMVSLDRAQKPVDPAPRNRAIIAWSATGAFAIAATVTGVLALNQQSKLKTDRDTANQDPNVLSNDSKKVKNFALATDILGGVAIVGGALSVWLTLSAVNAGNEPEKAKQQERAGWNFDIGPTGASVFGKF